MSPGPSSVPGPRTVLGRSVTVPGFPRRVAVLGATGSIGEKALAVAARHPDAFTVTAIAARNSVSALAEAATRHRVPRVAVADAEAAADLAGRLPAGTRLAAGAPAVAELAADPEVDLVVNGITGRAGLEASLAAVASGKMLALANKESMVLAGELIMRTAAAHDALVIPVDSEHSGLFQCLAGVPLGDVRRLIITASGGPFRGRSREGLASVTPAEALRHPVWPMGPRITVDSATLFNKGLEVLETHHIFGFPLERIDVWVHPQSVVHALVETVDGSLLAQLSAPDMTLPIQLAMGWPVRREADAPSCRLPDWKELRFEDPDHRTFPAIELARSAARRGGTAPAALNAADEVAVEAFLAGRLPFLEIIPVVEEVVGRVPVRPADSLEAVIEADRAAREAARARLERRIP
jgi:1-deoxy-D-xylulose-5-phosphate reductoisomerase